MFNQPLEGGHGDAAAYALGALEESARARFELHARQCAECQHEVDAFTAVTTQLALAVPQVDPPARLALQVAARVRASSQRLPHDREQPAVPHAVPVPVWAAAGASPAAPQPRWWDRGHRISAAVAAVSLAVALAGTGYAVAAHQEMRQTAFTSAQLAESLQLMYQPGMVWKTLNGTEQTPQAKARMCINPDGREGVIMTYDLPKLPRNSSYQLWLNHPEEERRASGGVFQVDDRGRGYLVVKIDRTFSQYKTAGVTREPAKGSSGPTGPRVLAGQI
jgi:anti-sigma-K factor RskA